MTRADVFAAAKILGSLLAHLRKHDREAEKIQREVSQLYDQINERVVSRDKKCESAKRFSREISVVLEQLEPLLARLPDNQVLIVKRLALWHDSLGYPQCANVIGLHEITDALAELNSGQGPDHQAARDQDLRDSEASYTVPEDGLPATDRDRTEHLDQVAPREV